MERRCEFWFDSIASIIALVKDSTATDALFVMKDGTEERLGLLTDFRVLYVSNPNGRTEKLDLTKIRSLEFFDLGK